MSCRQTNQDSLRFEAGQVFGSSGWLSLNVDPAVIKALLPAIFHLKLARSPSASVTANSLGFIVYDCQGGLFVLDDLGACVAPRLVLTRRCRKKRRFRDEAHQLSAGC